MRELAEKIKLGTVTPGDAGSVFFARAAELGADDKRRFLDAFLSAARYEDLAAAIHRGFIQKNYKHSGYLMDRAGALDLDARYFQVFLEIAREAGLSLEAFAPLLAAVFSAPDGSYLSAWHKSAAAYLLSEAYRDYGFVLGLLTRYDPSYAAYGVLMDADKRRTEEVLVERLLYGDGQKINFSAIRKLLLLHKIDVSYLFGPGYPDKPPKVREAIVRLALLYKNDPRAAAFLSRVKSAEPHARIRCLVESGESPRASAAACTVAGELEAMMVSGGSMRAEEFLSRLKSSEFSEVCDGVFFTVETDRDAGSIAVTHGGGLCDLDNTPFVPEPSARIGVLHACGLAGQYAYLKRLNIEQPFLQIRRPCFTPTDFEATSNVVSRLNGTVVTAGTLKDNLKSLGFRLLYGRGNEAGYARAAVYIGPDACVIEFTQTDFSDRDAVVLFYDARFYAAADLVRLGGRTYVEGVPPVRVSLLPPRAFSEFVYALYRLGNIAR